MPTEIIVLLVAGAAFAAGAANVLVSERRETARVRARQELARACGVRYVGLADERAVVGWHGPLRIRMETSGLRERHVRVLVEGLVRSLHVVPAGSGPGRPALVFADRDVTVGDPAFDAELVLQGPPATVRGRFTAETRALARAAFATDARVRIGGGALVAEFRESRRARVPTEGQLNALLALAHALEAGVPEISRLVAVAHSDPLPTVRVLALETLLKEAADVARTRGPLREALRDPAGAVRLLAATTLGDEGRPTLHALAADGEVDDAVSASAVTALGGYLTFARAQPLLDSALAAGRTRSACALLKVMGRGSVREAQVLVSVLERAADEAIVAAALEALHDTGAPVAEDVFLRALPSTAVQVARAAVRGLTRVGTARSVPLLREAEGRADLARAAREAIVAIQARLSGATPGQVSLTGSDAGQLSVAGSADGRVSIQDESAR